MKVLHINRNYLDSRLHQELIDNLNSLGIDNKVFVPVPSDKKKEIVPNDDVVVSKCFKTIDRFVFYWKQKKIINAVEEIISVANYNLIHAYTLFTDGNVAYKLSKKYNIPYIVAIRNTDVNFFFKKRFLLRNRGIEIMRNAKKIIFLSNSYKSQVLERYVPKEYKEEIESKIEIIPNGINDYWFRNINSHHNLKDKKSVKLICACVIDKNKNIAATQAAIKILKNDGFNCQLTVVGRVADKKEYKKLKKDENTTFFPKQPKEKLIKLYRDNDIFVMPSIYETFGLVYVEAMTQGLPVIYTRGQGFDEQFKDGIVGYSVCANDASEIAECIKRISNNYSIFDKGVSLSTKYKWDAIGKIYFDLYRQIAVKWGS